MATGVAKLALRTELAAQLAASLADAELAHQAAIEGATHSEARAENSKDTRGLEQSYLARGQAQRVAELAAGVAEVEALVLREFRPDDAVALGAVVTVEEGDARHRWFVAPAGGGSMLGDGTVIVTPSSPLGQALLGKHAGDDLELRLAARVRELSIVRVE